MRCTSRCPLSANSELVHRSKRAGLFGLRHGKRSEVLTIEAEDALIAALKVKHNHPEAIISYVRKSNRRGDRRNPHRKD